MVERTVETVDDGRYIVVKGRKWRATDPAITHNGHRDQLRAKTAAIVCLELLHPRKWVYDKCLTSTKIDPA